MEIIRAEKMGFCFGVKEAINIAEKVLEKDNEHEIYTLGMIVHNKTVIDELEEKGIKIIDEDDLDRLKTGDSVIVRAHGTKKEIYSKLDNKKIKQYDAACVFVKRARKLLEEHEKKGYKIIFVGDKEHPEVKGIISYGKNVKVVKDFEELKKIVTNEKEYYYLLAQTTLNSKKFDKIKEYIKNNFKNALIGDTICGATYERQMAVEELAKKVEMVLVIGGKNSSNTKKLYNISKSINLKTYHVESKHDLKKEWFEGKKRIGITAGASTPEKSIIEIEKQIREEIRYGKF